MPSLQCSDDASTLKKCKQHFADRKRMARAYVAQLNMLAELCYQRNYQSINYVNKVPVQILQSTSSD